MMLLFCMTMMFCVSCPLITPFGCLYFICKHYVDRHNIFFVYKPSKINKKVHASAISFIVLSTVVLQFFMTIFSVLRSGAALTELTLRSKYAVGLFLVSVNIFSGMYTLVIHRNSGFDSGSGRNQAISVPAGIEGIPVTNRN